MTPGRERLDHQEMFDCGFVAHDETVKLTLKSKGNYGPR